MGSREIGYNGVMADDAYIIRVYYTTDDLGNLQVASGLETWETTIQIHMVQIYQMLIGINITRWKTESVLM